MENNKLTNTELLNQIPAKTSVFQSFVIGSIAGMAEVALNHPLWTIKVRIQCGNSFTLNPRLLYRGILVNMASVVPGATLQVGLNRFFQKLFFDNAQILSQPQQIVTAFLAGELC